MSDYRKKWLIVTLLFASCLLSFWLLMTVPGHTVRPPHSLGVVDSLIQVSFEERDVSGGQVRSGEVAVDSLFRRVTWRVDVPPQFSKTDYHLHLQRIFQPYGITLPARVHFPGRDMDIHLLLGETVIRTIRLQTDSELADPAESGEDADE